MHVTSIVLLLTGVLNIALGFFVHVYNPGRQQNRKFAIFSTNVGIWALCMLLGATRQDAAAAALWIRFACAISACLPLTFLLLCGSIAEADLAQSSRHRLRRLLTLTTPIVVLMVFTPPFLRGVTLPTPNVEFGAAFPEPVYGPLFLPYNLFFLVAFFLTMFTFVRSVKRSTGVRRIELQFVLLGMLLTLLFTLSTQIFIPMLTGSTHSQPLGPIGVLAMNVTIAYGIATRRIMDAAGVLRRAMAYGLLAVYIALVFFVIHVMVSVFIPESVNRPLQGLTTSLIAAIVVASSMGPVQAFMQRVTDRVFFASRGTRIANTVESLTAALQSVATMPELLARFSDAATRITKAREIQILLDRKRNFEQVFPESAGEHPGIVLAATSPIPRFLETQTRPLVADELPRERRSPEVAALIAAMQEHRIALAVGVFSRGRLIGIVLSGVRTSGHIYSREDQNDLQVVCKHLGVAIENARLYTESIQHRLHSDTLLDNLINGVVATDADGEISMLNREAQRICRLALPAGRALSLAELPTPIAEALRRTLQSGSGERDVSASIRLSDAPPLPVRIGTSPLRDPDGTIMGALAVLSDQTTLHRLESQLRRTDRLASVGTLAAGMAHEIKNPLVTISTFTQLLPERFQDPEFRGTFTELVGHEVKRMNGLVNQLLRFARPTPALLAPARLGGVLDHSLLLVEQQFHNQRVLVEKRYSAEHAVILADVNQLEQAFVNLLLNALQAMEPEGRLTATLRLADPIKNENGGAPGSDSRFVEVLISDTGRGIPPEQLGSIFDPFFTTRSEGTGLGLSVAHGIITENHGVIEVASEVGVGTTFTLSFPMVPQDAPT